MRKILIGYLVDMLQEKETVEVGIKKRKRRETGVKVYVMGELVGYV